MPEEKKIFNLQTILFYSHALTCFRMCFLLVVRNMRILIGKISCTIINRFSFDCSVESSVLKRTAYIFILIIQSLLVNKDFSLLLCAFFYGWIEMEEEESVLFLFYVLIIICSLLLLKSFAWFLFCLDLIRERIFLYFCRV